jgi:hypothetical protein
LFSSALAYAGFNEQGLQVNLVGTTEFLGSPRTLKDLCQFVFGRLGFGLHCHKLHKSTKLKDLLGKMSSSIVLVLLDGSNARQDHAVSTIMTT